MGIVAVQDFAEMRLLGEGAFGKVTAEHVSKFELSNKKHLPISLPRP